MMYGTSQTICTKLAHYSPPLGFLISDLLRALEIHAATVTIPISVTKKHYSEGHRKQTAKAEDRLKREMTMVLEACRQAKSVTSGDIVQLCGIHSARAKDVLNICAKQGLMLRGKKRKNSFTYVLAEGV